MTYDYEEREQDLEDSPIHTRRAHREIPRSLEEIGYARPRAPFACRDRTGRWRQAHCFDERSLGEPCLFCGKRRPAQRQVSAA